MSHQGFSGTFQEFKQKFYSRIGDGSCFNVQDINLLKVVLDGLKVQYSSRGKMNHYFNIPIFLFFFYLLTKTLSTCRIRRAFKKSTKSNNDGSRILIGFNERYIEENSRYHSSAFQRFFNEFGRTNFCYIIETNNNLNADYDFDDIQFGFNFLAIENIRFYLELKKFVKSLKNKWTKKECLDIKGACFVFYIQYLKWDYFLKYKSISKVIIEQHYHREGLILACRRKGIDVIELQHGLISNEDIFYVFPHQVSGIITKALFPESMLVFGDYWKQVLLRGCEYKSEDIFILGHYQYAKNTRNHLLFPPQINKKRILITTQYSIEKYYIDYVKNISPRLDRDWEIILKPHPTESINVYAELSSLENVRIIQEDLESLILSCEFLISIFSTTIFDAVRLKKLAFSLYFPLFSDYVNGIITSGAAYLLQPEDNPVEQFNNTTKKEHGNSFYSGLDIQMCRKVFKI